MAGPFVRLRAYLFGVWYKFKVSEAENLLQCVLTKKIRSKCFAFWQEIVISRMKIFRFWKVACRNGKAA